MDIQVLNDLVAWRNESPKARILEMKWEPFHSEEPKIWIYDQLIGAGQFVTCAEEINLAETRKQRLRDEIARLQQLEGGESLGAIALP